MNSGFQSGTPVCDLSHCQPRGFLTQTQVTPKNALRAPTVALVTLNSST